MTTPDPPSRMPAIDWLRALAVVAIFFGHVAYIFSITGQASIRNAEPSLAASVYGAFIYQWAVPLLFLLAGASSWYSLQHRTGQVYLRERVRRLLIPLLVGSVLLIPWIGYMSARNQGTFQGSYWEFIPVHFAWTWASLHVPQHRHGPIALYHTSWYLWFLGYLLLFAGVSPVLRRGRVSLHALVAMCERRGGLLLLVAPMAAVRMALGASFPAYPDWTDTLVFFLCFVYGRSFMTDARFLRAAERDRRIWLAVGCAAYALMLASFATGHFARWYALPAYTFDYLFYQVLLAVNTWAWVLALFGFGLRHLQIDNAARHYAASAVLPFYVLHQVAIATIGTWVVEWNADVWMKFAMISTAAFVMTMVAYEYGVRRSRLLGALLGVKDNTPRLPVTVSTSSMAMHDDRSRARSAS